MTDAPLSAPPLSLLPAGALSRPPVAVTPRLALKISVNTFRGARDGIPWLLETLQAYDAKATFFVTLGPDRSGRQLRQVFGRGGLARLRTLRQHHDWGSLLYGWLLPAPTLGKRCAAVLRQMRDLGFEVGIQPWDRHAWQKRAATADNRWAEADMTRAIAAFRTLFDALPDAYSVGDGPGHRHTLRLQQRLGFLFAADSRGTAPFLPLWQAEPVQCPQIPVTLPTLDEIMQREGLDAGIAAGHLLAQTAAQQAHDSRQIPVYGLHIEREGVRQREAFVQLLQGWRDQGYRLCTLGEVARELDIATLPRCVLVGAHTARTAPLIQSPMLGSVPLAKRPDA